GGDLVVAPGGALLPALPVPLRLVHRAEVVELDAVAPPHLEQHVPKEFREGRVPLRRQVRRVTAAGVRQPVPGERDRRTVDEGVELLHPPLPRLPQHRPLSGLRPRVETAILAQERAGPPPAIANAALPALPVAPRPDVEAPGTQSDPLRGTV